MAVKTWVGRFAIVQGQPQEEGPHLRSFPRQRPDEEEDELYVLVEPTGASGDQYVSQIPDFIGQEYRQDPLSLTGAMLRSLRAAHQRLRDWNQTSLREHRISVGVSCMAVRGRTAYLAQVGPSIAYHVGDGRFRRIVPEDGAAEPLGEAEQTEPAFSRYSLSPGDLLLLAPLRIEELLDEEALRSILLRGGEEALVELYRLARDQQEFSLVLLACVVEPETDTAPSEAEGTVPPAAEGEEAPAAPGSWPPAEAPGVQLEDGPAAPPLGLAQPKVRLKGMEAEIRYPRTTGLRASLPQIPPLAIVGVLALLVVGLLAWCVIPSALRESREDRFDILMAEAGAELDAALDTTADAAQRRLSLESAEANLAEAELLQPDDPAVAALRGELEAVRDALDAVVELPEMEPVADISGRVPGAVSLAELKLGGGGAYILDQEQGRVIAVPLFAPSPEPVVVLEPGSLVGTEVVGRPQDIVWAWQLNALLVLDDARRLIAVTPGQAPRLLALRDAEGWGSADDIYYTGGSLYVLDGDGNQVWRYLPTETGFDSEREPLLTSANLEGAKELAVGDGVYIVKEDGAILRFEQGVEQPFTQAGTDEALASPASPIVLPASDRLVVADRGNHRIVVFALDGTFMNQAKSPTISTDLRAITLERSTGLLYVLVGGALYRTPLLVSP